MKSIYQKIQLPTFVLGWRFNAKIGSTLKVKHRDLAFMGFASDYEFKTILNNIKFCKTDILAFQPDVIIFGDYRVLT